MKEMVSALALQQVVSGGVQLVDHDVQIDRKGNAAWS